MRDTSGQPATGNIRQARPIGLLRRRLPVLAWMWMAGMFAVQAAALELTPERYNALYPDALCTGKLSNGPHLVWLRQASCVAQTRLNPPLSPETLAAILLGQLRFDPAAAAACLKSLNQFHREDPPECDKVVLPQLTPGAVCVHEDACIGGRCTRDGPSCAGTCRLLAPPGGRCSGHAACADGGACVIGVCQRAHSAGRGAWCAGDACAQGLYCTTVLTGLGLGTCEPLRSSGARCTSMFECADGLRCPGNAESPGVCTPPVPEGGACSSVVSCGTGLACNGGVCRKKVGVGEACSDMTSCLGAGEVACAGPKRQSTCQPQRVLGERCTLDVAPQDWEKRCALPYKCLAGTCRLPPRAGEACDPADVDPCRDQLRCDKASRRCVELPGPGDTCNGKCRQGARCEDGRCVAVVCK